MPTHIHKGLPARALLLFGKLFLFAFGTAILLSYLTMEVFVNWALVHLYSMPLTEIMSTKRDLVENVDFVGRCISGVGLTFMVLSSLPLPLRNKRAKVLLKLALAPVLWLFFVVVLKLLVDVVAVHLSNEASKLEAVRALLFKEAYIADKVKLESFSALDSVESPDIITVSMALSSSIASLSPTINRQIRDKMNIIASNSLREKDKQEFEAKAQPILDKLYNEAASAYKSHEEANRLVAKYQAALDDPQLLVGFTNKVRQDLENHLFAKWKTYRTDMDGIDLYVNEVVSEPFTNAWIDTYNKIRKDNCNEACQVNLINSFKKRYVPPHKKIVWIDDDSWFDTDMSILDYFGSVLRKILSETKLSPALCLVESVGRWTVNADIDECEYMKTVYGDLIGRVREAHTTYLEQRYDGELDISDRDEFESQDYMEEFARRFLIDQKIMVSKSWAISSDNGQLKKAVKAKISKDMAGIKRRHQKNYGRTLSVNQTYSFDKFVSLSFFKSKYKKRLGSYYYAGYSPEHSVSDAFDEWRSVKYRGKESDVLAVLDNYMMHAFKPGGALFNVGADSVKIAIIPVVSIVMTMIAVLFAIARSGFLFGGIFNNKPVRVTISVLPVLLFVGVLVLIFAQQDNLTRKVLNTHFSAEQVSACISSEPNESTQKSGSCGIDSLFFIVYAAIVDIEAVMFNTINSSFQRQAEYALDSFGSLLQPIRNAEMAVSRVVDQSIDSIFSGDITLDGYTKHAITVFDVDHRGAMFAGFTMLNDEVKTSHMPFLLANAKLDELLNLRMMVKPDYSTLFANSLMNATDTEYWASMASSEAYTQTLREKMEESLTHYMNSKQGRKLRKMVGEHENLIMIRRSNNQYMCYSLPEINILSLLSGTDVLKKGVSCRLPL